MDHIGGHSSARGSTITHCCRALTFASARLSYSN